MDVQGSNASVGIWVTASSSLHLITQLWHRPLTLVPWVYTEDQGKNLNRRKLNLRLVRAHKSDRSRNIVASP